MTSLQSVSISTGSGHVYQWLDQGHNPRLESGQINLDLCARSNIGSLQFFSIAHERALTMDKKSVLSTGSEISSTI